MDTLRIPAEEALALLREKFRQGKQTGVLVTGTSMVPFLRHEKDHVLLSPPTGDYRVGQILMFQQGDRLILHRLRKMQDGRLIMNGDGQRRLEVIEPRQVVAVASAVIRRSGRVISCKSLLWRGLSALWRPTRPIRPILLRAAAVLKACYQKFRR